MNFVHTQLPQYLPLQNMEPSRVRTGFEKIIAQRTSIPFAYVAKENGKIIDIDEKVKMIKIKYKTGDIESVSYGEEYTSNAGQGFYTTQNIVLNNIKLNQPVKKGDVICYNDGCFTADPYSKQVNWNIGKLANVALLESSNTMEDSSAVSKKLATQLTFPPVHVRLIALTTDTIVHQIADIGTKLNSTDPLIVFEENPMSEFVKDSSDDKEVIELLSRMNKSTPKAKYNGTVVKIEPYYKTDFENISDSLQIIIKKYINVLNKKSKYAKDSSNKEDFLEINKVKGTDRVSNIELNEETILLKFYIKEELEVGVGDKIVLDSSLKSVNSRVIEEPIIAEDNTKIDCLFSVISQEKRIINSPILQGYTNQILSKLEEEIINIFEE